MDNSKRDYCRLCAGFQPKLKLVELENNKEKSQDIAKKLSRFNIQVNLCDNVLPKVVCITCVTSLERAFNFVAAVEQGQLALSNLISVRHIIKQERILESFSDDENSSYGGGDSLTENYLNAVNVKMESDNVNSCKSLSKSQNTKHNVEGVSEGDYIENINLKGESKQLNSRKSAPLNSEQVEVVFSNDDNLGRMENDSNLNVESNNAALKSGDANQSNRSVPNDENFIYVLVTDEHDLDKKKKSKVKKKVKVTSTSKSASSKGKNRNKKIEGKKPCYRWNSLPLSELELSWNDYSWMCSYCETQFPNFDELRTHSMENHKVCNPFHCIDCNVRKLHLNSFLVHVKRHRQYLKFSCYKCPMKFRTLSEATQHREVHMTSDFICFGCNTNYSTQEEWFRHTKTFYKNTRATSILAMQDDSLTCYICHKVYKTKNQLNCHLLTHTNNICEICGKCFHQKSSLESHLMSHSDARPYQCEICSSTFKTPRRLKLHIATHDENKPFGCDTCGKSFRLKTQLVNHLMIHTGDLPHACSYCTKRFRNKSLLNQHIRQHTGVKPYCCSICKWDFSNWANYNKHMKRKHDMNMAKTKRTPAGSFPIDPNTGEVIYPSEKKMTQFKRKIMELKNAGRKRVTRNKKSHA